MTQIVARILTVQIVRFTFPRSLVVVLFSKNSTHLRVTFPKKKKQKKTLTFWICLKARELKPQKIIAV